MSAPVISAVVPAVLPHSGRRPTAGDTTGRSRSRGPLPLPSLLPGRTSNVVYGLAALDDRGRLADLVVMRTLGWCAGQRLAITETGRVLTVHTEPTGNHHVTSQGHLRLPAPVRHRFGLTPGTRVLLAADPDRSRLTLYPPAALDRALSADLSGGESA
jgi:hypothetical protein